VCDAPGMKSLFHACENKIRLARYSRSAATPPCALAILSVQIFIARIAPLIYLEGRRNYTYNACVDIKYHSSQTPPEGIISFRERVPLLPSLVIPPYGPALPVICSGDPRNAPFALESIAAAFLSFVYHHHPPLGGAP